MLKFLISLFFNADGPCSTDPCQNGGTCLPLGTSQVLYTCQCPPGTDGVNCEVRPGGKSIMTVFKLHSIKRQITCDSISIEGKWFEQNNALKTVNPPYQEMGPFI